MNVLGLEVFYHLVQTPVLSHQLIRCLGTNTFYWLEIIATEQ